LASSENVSAILLGAGPGSSNDGNVGNGTEEKETKKLGQYTNAVEKKTPNIHKKICNVGMCLKR